MKKSKRKKLTEEEKKERRRKQRKARREDDRVDNSYIIKDKYLGDIQIKHTANAWWESEVKVVALLNAYKMGCTTKECQLYAGITEDQLKYFRKEHSEFSTRLNELKTVPTIHSRKLITLAIEKGSVRTAQWFLERKVPQEFKERKDVTSDDKPILIEDVM